MSQILSPERESGELEGDLELEELAQRLEPGEEKVEGYDLIYRKDEKASGQSQGSVYTPTDSSQWYDDGNLQDVELQDFEIDINELRINAVTGETLLIDSEGQETRYDVFSSFEGTTTFTQEVGLNNYVFRYDKHENSVKAAEIGSDEPETVSWGNEELKKRVRLVDRVYHEARRTLWESQREQELSTRNSKFERLRPIYNAVTNKIEQDGKAVINEQTHVGSSRGADIVNDFFTAAVRHPDDSPENYTESSGKDSYPVIIREN